MEYKVLVVEDQTMPRQLFESIVRNAPGFSLVDSIDSADMADLYCAKHAVDLIIMDIVMQEGDHGISAAAKIKRAYPAIKILMVTSMPDASFLQKAREAGADSFWYKEVQETPMVEIMERTMAGEHIYPGAAPRTRLGNTWSTELTGREQDVLRLLVGGFTDREIAEKLMISFHTVRFHLNSMMAKTGSSSRTELAIRAVRTGVVVPEV